LETRTEDVLLRLLC